MSSFSRGEIPSFCFLPGRTDTCVQFSPGELTHVLSSPQENSNKGGFLPGRTEYNINKKYVKVYIYIRIYMDIYIWIYMDIYIYMDMDYLVGQAFWLKINCPSSESSNIRCGVASLVTPACTACK
jgi:hypothetical protein